MSDDQVAWTAAATALLRSALLDADDSVLEAALASLRAALPAAAPPLLLSVSRLLATAQPGCGDLARAWSAAEGGEAAAAAAGLLPVRRGLPVGSLRCAGGGLVLADCAGAELRCAPPLEAGAEELAALLSGGGHVLATAWALPAGAGAALELRAALPLGARPGPGPAPAGGGAEGVLEALTPALRLQGEPACYGRLRRAPPLPPLTLFLRGAEVARCVPPLPRFRSHARSLRPLLAQALGRPLRLRGWAERRLAGAAAALLCPGPAAAAASARGGSWPGCACAACAGGGRACFQARLLGCAGGGALRLRLPCGAEAQLLPRTCAEALPPGARPGALLLLLHARRCDSNSNAFAADFGGGLALAGWAAGAEAAPAPRPPPAPGLRARDAWRARLAQADLAEKAGGWLGGGAAALREAAREAQAAGWRARGAPPPPPPPPRAPLLAEASGEAEAEAEAEGGPATMRLPSVARLRAAAAAAWSRAVAAQASAAPRAWGSRAALSQLDGGAGVARALLPLPPLLAGLCGAGEAAALLARARRGRAGLELWDSSGWIEAAPEGAAVADGACLAIARGRLLAEGRPGDARPLRLALCFAPARAARCAALDAPGAPAAPPPPPPPPLASVAQLRARPPPDGARVSLVALVVGERLSSAHLGGGGGAAPRALLRLRDPGLPGQPGLDLFLDALRGGILPPGCAPGALLRLRALRAGCSRGTPYLRPDGESRIEVLRAPPRAPGGGAARAHDACAGEAARALRGARARLAQLQPPGAPPPPRPRALLLLRPAALRSATLRWACARCGADVAEAEERRAGCADCAPPPHLRPHGAAALQMACLVAVEDGGGAAECAAEGEAARLLLGLRPGALAALTRRHGRLELRPARAPWAEAGGFAPPPLAPLAVEGPAGPLPAAEAAEARAALRALRAGAAPELLVWASWQPGGAAAGAWKPPTLRVLAVREARPREELRLRLAPPAAEEEDIAVEDEMRD